MRLRAGFRGLTGASQAVPPRHLRHIQLVSGRDSVGAPVSDGTVPTASSFTAPNTANPFHVKTSVGSLACTKEITPLYHGHILGVLFI